MLTYRLLKNNAGVLLCGDYGTLRDLNDVVHEVNKASVIVRDKEGGFLGLAFDARKAYEGQREVLQPPEHMPEVGIRYGAAILWPVLLVQCRMLRAALAFFDSTKLQQAIAFSLEDVIESAIKDAFDSQADAILEAWYRIDPVDESVEQRLDSRGAQFCAWTKDERRANLAGLLASFSPMYDVYFKHWVGQGVKGLVSPEEFEVWEGREWPDPKW